LESSATIPPLLFEALEVRAMDRRVSAGSIGNPNTTTARLAVGVV